MNAIATLALLAPIALIPQDNGSQRNTKADVQIPTASELVFQQYVPRNISARELYQYAEANLSRRFQVRNEESGELSVHASIQSLGGRLIIYEKAAAAQRLLEMLKSLDLPSVSDAAGARAVEYLTQIYNPQYASNAQLYSAL